MKTSLTQPAVFHCLCTAWNQRIWICCRINRFWWPSSSKAIKVSNPRSSRLSLSRLLNWYAEWWRLHQQCNPCTNHLHCCTESGGSCPASAREWIQRNLTFCLHNACISIQHSSGRFWKKCLCFCYNHISIADNSCSFSVLSSHIFNSSHCVPVPCCLWCL